MFPTETKRHHRIKKIIIGIIAVPVFLFTMLIIIGFVSNVFYRSKIISQGDYTVISKSQNQTPAPLNLYDDAKKKLYEGLGNPSFGAETPQVTIVEFADFACPYCKASSAGLRELSTLYKDKLKVVFRDWPAHENSLTLAMAGQCANEQGKFWQMHDKLYANQSSTFGADTNDLTTLAAAIGIYNDQFQTCLDSKEYLGRIQKNVMDADTLGVVGTPTWFVNGEKIEGELTKQDLETIINQYVTK